MLFNRKCCIDSCVWIKYAGHSKVATLIKYIVDKELVVFADLYLLSEIHDALIEVFDFSIKDADFIIQKIQPFLLLLPPPPRNVYRLSPDPKDNYPYDICIQNNCSLLIT